MRLRTIWETLSEQVYSLPNAIHTTVCIFCWLMIFFVEVGRYHIYERYQNSWGGSRDAIKAHGSLSMPYKKQTFCIETFPTTTSPVRGGWVALPLYRSIARPKGAVFKLRTWTAILHICSVRTSTFKTLRDLFPFTGDYFWFMNPRHPFVNKLVYWWGWIEKQNTFLENSAQLTWAMIFTVLKWRLES